MTCEDLSTCFVDYVTSALPEDEAETVRLHLASCEACRAEVDGLGAVWQALGELADEEPDAALSTRFYALLDAESETRAAPWNEHSRAPWGQGGDSWWRRLAGLWPARPAAQMAVAAAALVLGLGAGAWLPRGSGELAEMRAEMASLNRLVAISLLHQESASSRLQGVSYSRQSAGDEEVVAALVDTVDGDESVGVRLAAIDALARFADRPEVAAKLRASLPGQSSPLVQLALIDLLADVDGPETARTLRELASRPDLAEAVRSRIAERLGPRA